MKNLFFAIIFHCTVIAAAENYHMKHCLYLKMAYIYILFCDNFGVAGGVAQLFLRVAVATPVDPSLPVHTIVNLYIVIPYLLVILVLISIIIFIIFFVSVILLHCSSFCHKSKFLLCVTIPGNKADSENNDKDQEK